VLTLIEFKLQLYLYKQDPQFSLEAASVWRIKTRDKFRKLAGPEQRDITLLENSTATP